MTRTRLLVLVIVLGAALAAGLFVRGSGHSDPPVAHVGSEAITRDQLALVVDHFRLEAKDEGAPFPVDNSDRFQAVRNRLLGVLVYRAELAQAARRLGVRVTNLEVLRRVKVGGEEQSFDQFDYGTVKEQLLYERIYAKVTRGIKAATIPERVARKNAAMKRYLDRLQRETQVRYEPGYEPGP